MTIEPDQSRQEQAPRTPVVFQFQPKVFQRLEATSSYESGNACSRRNAA